MAGSWRRPSPRRDHIINVHIARTTPAPSQRIKDHAGASEDLKAAAGQSGLKLTRGDKLLPTMGAARHPAQNIFCGDNAKGEALQRAIQSGEEDKTVRRSKIARRRHERLHVRDMLDNLHGQNEIEPAARLRQSFRVLAAIIDFESRVLGVNLRDLDIAGDWIEPGHASPQSGHGFAQQAGAAPYVDGGQTFKRPNRRCVGDPLRNDAVAEPADSKRINLVQRSHGTVGVPPILAQALEVSDFVRIGARRSVRHPFCPSEASGAPKGLKCSGSLDRRNFDKNARPIRDRTSIGFGFGRAASCDTPSRSIASSCGARRSELKLRETDMKRETRHFVVEVRRGTKKQNAPFLPQIADPPEADPTMRRAEEILFSRAGDAPTEALPRTGRILESVASPPAAEPAPEPAVEQSQPQRRRGRPPGSKNRVRPESSGVAEPRPGRGRPRSGAAVRHVPLTPELVTAAIETIARVAQPAPAAGAQASAEPRPEDAGPKALRWTSEPSLFDPELESLQGAGGDDRRAADDDFEESALANETVFATGSAKAARSQTVAFEDLDRLALRRMLEPNEKWRSRLLFRALARRTRR